MFWKLSCDPPRLTSTGTSLVTCSGTTLPLRSSSTPAALTNRIRAKKKERKKRSPFRSGSVPICSPAGEQQAHTCLLLPSEFVFFLSSPSSLLSVAVGDGGWMSLRREPPDEPRTVGRVTEQQQKEEEEGTPVWGCRGSGSDGWHAGRWPACCCRPSCVWRQVGVTPPVKLCYFNALWSFSYLALCPAGHLSAVASSDMTHEWSADPEEGSGGTLDELPYRQHAALTRRRRNVLFPSGVRLCTQETVDQVAANHLRYFHLRGSHHQDIPDALTLKGLSWGERGLNS